MKRIFCLLLCPIMAVSGQKKDLSLTDLMSLSRVPDEQFSTYAKKRGFQPNREYGNVPEQPAFTSKSKDKPLRCLSKYESSNATTLLFQTTEESEFNQLKNELKKNEFRQIQENAESDVQSYQKSNMIIRTVATDKGDGKIYNVYIECAALPMATEVVFAEDLLKLQSHENVSAVFGDQNVKLDTFWYTDKEYVKCSVLYPNSNAQAIFIWEDELNLRNASYIIIGGSLREGSAETAFKGTEINKWRSTQGPYLGMSLNDIVNLNNQHVDMYGWETEYPGYVAPKNKGNLIFNRLGLQFNCLDCKEDLFYTKTNVINSSKLIADRSRVFVQKMIILPEQSATAKN